ncbi:MAG: branched-chain amino acid transport system substrate-binding protein [Actinomycetota bacterium]|jgi:branched-chain amino acid transport system substrate-binding protein
MRRISGLLPLLLLAPLLASCSSGGDRTVTVGAVYPTAGAQGVGGNEELRGVRLAVDWTNRHGGIDGKRVVLREADADRPEAVPDALAALHAKGVNVVIGSHGSATSAVAAREAQRRKMSFWETGAVGEVDAPGAGGQTFFRLAPMGASLGRHAIAFVRDALAPKLPAHGQLRYAVTYIDDSYGRAVGKGAEAEIAESGQTFAGAFPYDPQTKDFAPLATQLAGAEPDVLFAVSYLEDGVALRRATLHLPLLAAIGTSSSFCHPAFGDALGDEAVGLFASDKPDAAHVNQAGLRPEGRQALAWANRAYTARFEQAMSSHALSGFSSAVALLMHVAPAARTLTTTALARAATTVKLPEGTLANGAGLDLAPTGAVDAGANRRAAGVIWEWVAPRTRAVVWPRSLATHDVVALPVQR